MSITQMTSSMNAQSILNAADEAALKAELRERSHDTGCDAYYTATWVEGSERREWDLPCYLIRAGGQVVMWSYTDEAGVQDVKVADAEVNIHDQIREYATGLASDLA